MQKITQKDIPKSAYDILKVVSPGATVSPEATVSPNFNKLKFEKNIDIFLLQKVENSIVDPPTNFLWNRCSFGFCLKS